MAALYLRLPMVSVLLAAGCRSDVGAAPRGPSPAAAPDAVRANQSPDDDALLWTKSPHTSAWVPGRLPRMPGLRTDGAVRRIGDRIVWVDLTDPRGPTHLAALAHPVMVYADAGALEAPAVLQALADLSARTALGMTLKSGTSSAALASLAQIPKLRALHISGPSITDPTLQLLAPLRELRWLRVVATRITDAGLAHLEPLARLRTLHLVNCEIDGPGLAALARLPGLRRLTLERDRIREFSAPRIAGLRRLESLHLAHNGREWSTEAFSELASMTSLRELGLRGSMIDGDGLASLASLSQLRRLDLGECWYIRDRGLDVLASFPELTHLDLDHVPITDAGLRHLDMLTALHSLNLSSTQITTANVGPLAQLSTLDLDSSSITDAGLEPLAQLPALRTLKLNNTAVTGVGLVHLPTRSKLEVLELGRSKATDQSLASIAGLTTLQSLDASNTALSDRGLRHLERLRRLEQLWLSGTKVGDAGIASLSRLTELRALSLAETHVGDPGVARLAALSQLHTLALTRTGVTARGAEALAKLEHLRVLYLSPSAKQAKLPPQVTIVIE